MKVNMVVIGNAAFLISPNFPALFSLILKLHGIIILWKIDEKKAAGLGNCYEFEKM